MTTKQWLLVLCVALLVVGALCAAGVLPLSVWVPILLAGAAYVAAQV